MATEIDSKCFKKTEMFDILMNDMPLENNELDFDNNLLLQ